MPKPQTIPWSRFIGEFFVIVFGVLAALAVDSWQDRQQESALGQAYLHGLLRDLTVDSTMLASTSENLALKRASLDVLLEVAWGSAEIGPDSVGRLLLPSAVLGWRMPQPQVAAYEELQSTGALRLIADPDLRSGIVLYYEDWERQLERLDRHRSTYPNAIYSLAPPEVLAGGPVGREAADLMSRLRTGAMRDQLNHEANTRSSSPSATPSFRSTSQHFCRGFARNSASPVRPNEELLLSAEASRAPLVTPLICEACGCGSRIPRR